jgi:hypothetical protein
MHQPVDQGRGQGVVHVKDFAPFPKGSIRGDHDRSHFITGGDNLEQQIGTMLVDGQIAQLIEDGNSGTHQAPSIHELDSACQCAATLVLPRETSEPVFEREGRATRGWDDRADVAGVLVRRARRATLLRLVKFMSLCVVAAYPRQVPGCG